jgi:hypothetical protein
VLYSRAGVCDKAKMTVGDIVEIQAKSRGGVRKPKGLCVYDQASRAKIVLTSVTPDRHSAAPH